jgi:hypothetical protein
VDAFEIFRTILIVVVSVTILVPLDVPLAALAYRVHVGAGPMPMDATPFWWRATGMALGLAAASLVLMFLDYWLVAFIDFPPGFVHGMLLLLYLAGGVWFVFWVFELDELLEGASVLLIYIGIPCLLFAYPMMNWQWWPVPFVASFLQPTTT